MHATALSLPLGARRLAALALSLSLTGSLLRAAPKDADAFPTFDSYIKVSGQAADVTGNGAAYAERAHSPEAGSYGIEDMHYYKDVDETTSLTFDGRAMFGRRITSASSSSSAASSARSMSATRVSGPSTTASAASFRRTAPGCR